MFGQKERIGVVLESGFWRIELKKMNFDEYVGVGICSLMLSL